MNIKKQKNIFPCLFSIVMLFALCGQIIAGAAPRRFRAVPMQCASALPEAVKMDDSKAAAQELIYTEHARERMAERNITEDDVKRIIMTGQRFLDTKYSDSIVYRERSKKTSKQLVVVTKKDDQFPNKIIIITVYNSYAPLKVFLQRHMQVQDSAPTVTRQQAKASTLPSTSLKAAVKVPGSLHDAAERGDLSRVAELLDAGATVNGQELNHSCFPFYDTPLHRAALKGHEEVVRLLISRGALVNEPDGQGRTPLHLTVIRHHENIALLLIEHGADINQQAGWEGDTPLHHAIMVGYKPFVQFLIDHGADINKPDRAGRTPLQSAGYSKNMTRLLVSRGALASKPTHPTRKSCIDVFAITAACAALLYVGSSSIALLVGRL